MCFLQVYGWDRGTLAVEPEPLVYLVRHLIVLGFPQQEKSMSTPQVPNLNLPTEIYATFCNGIDQTRKKPQAKGAKLSFAPWLPCR
jgi:hypothetical protein